MALTGIEIFKLLPKTNCKDCGVPTCLAFAMNVAAGKADVAACPHISDEAKAQLVQASAPPVKVVTIGSGENIVKIGGETVAFRHEKRFENKPGIAVLINTSMDDTDVEARIARFNKLRYERVGIVLRAEMIAVKDEGKGKEPFAALTGKVAEATDAAIILMSDDPDVLEAGLNACAGRKPLIYAAKSDSIDKMAALAKANSCPVVVKGTSLDEAAGLADRMAAAGVSDIVLDTGARSVKQVYQDQVIIRTGALARKNKGLGYPTITIPAEMTDDPLKEAVIASALIAKYAGIIVLSDIQGESLFPLLVDRLNIYTDPQRPLATKPGIYEINKPDENSPVMITSNFSLTYFIVSGEIETSKVPTWLLVIDTEGLSVLTAWAAGKFVGDTLAPFIRKCGIESKISHRKLILPGYASAESGILAEELPDWTIVVGPKEGSQIPAFLRDWSG